MGIWENDQKASALRSADKEIFKLRDQIKGLVDALEELARLGGPGGKYGNSIGNEIAIRALEKYRGGAE